MYRPTKAGSDGTGRKENPMDGQPTLFDYANDVVLVSTENLTSLVYAVDRLIAAVTVMLNDPHMLTTGGAR